MQVSYWIHEYRTLYCTCVQYCVQYCIAPAYIARYYGKLYIMENSSTFGGCVRGLRSVRTTAGTQVQRVCLCVLAPCVHSFVFSRCVGGDRKADGGVEGWGWVRGERVVGVWAEVMAASEQACGCRLPGSPFVSVFAQLCACGPDTPEFKAAVWGLWPACPLCGPPPSPPNLLGHLRRRHNQQPCCWERASTPALNVTQCIRCMRSTISV